jgi:hypothetical protein
MNPNVAACCFDIDCPSGFIQFVVAVVMKTSMAVRFARPRFPRVTAFMDMTDDRWHRCKEIVLHAQVAARTPLSAVWRWLRVAPRMPCDQG